MIWRVCYSWLFCYIFLSILRKAEVKTRNQCCPHLWNKKRVRDSESCSGSFEMPWHTAFDRAWVVVGEGWMKVVCIEGNMWLLLRARCRGQIVGHTFSNLCPDWGTCILFWAQFWGSSSLTGCQCLVPIKTWLLQVLVDSICHVQ